MTTNIRDEHSNYLFVATHIGQVRKANDVAVHLGLTKFDLVILYTKKNLEMPRIARAAADPSLVDRIELVEIEVNSNEIDLIAAKSNFRVYCDVLEKYQPDHLYVSSFERHYALLCGEAKKRGIKLALFEEGTAILKVALPEYATFPERSIFSSIYRVYKSVWSDQPIAVFLFAPLFAIIKQLIVLPKLIYDTAVAVIRLPNFQRSKVETAFPDFLPGWRDFDQVICSDSETLKPYFPDAEAVDLPIAYDNLDQIQESHQVIEEYGIDDQTMLFASQRYNVGSAILHQSIVEILANLAKSESCRIIIKLHPKEPEAIVSRYVSAIQRLNVQDQVSIMEAVYVPAEYLAVESECLAVVGISSSTLMYAPKARPSLRSISIGQALLADLRDSGIPPSKTEEIYQHVSIISLLSYVEQAPSLRAKHE